jgi:hypothetical protein
LLIWLPWLLTSVWVIGFALVGAALYLGGPMLLQLGSLGHILIDWAEWFANFSRPWIEVIAHAVDRLIPG